MTSEIIIIGGGIIGLTIALEIQLKGIKTTVISRNFKEAATHAAGGMLAPQAEQIPPSPMLNICLESRNLYPHWTQKIEQISKIDTKYWPCGILAPTYQEQPSSPNWLNHQQIRSIEPQLGAEVTGGWWFPNDGQVDNRALAISLWTACQEIGVQIIEAIAVNQLQTKQKQIIGIETTQGTKTAAHYILATGAWSSDLLPIQVYPQKGQMCSLRLPPNQTSPLSLILFGHNTYIIPRQDNRFIIGATSETVGFKNHNTPSGINTLLSNAIKLYPPLQDWILHEYWTGFRPATPDELPILGPGPYTNLTLATGHYRNGILLAPITGSIIRDWVLYQTEHPALAHFKWDRFES